MSLALTSGTWQFEINLVGQSSSIAGTQFGVNYTGTVTSISAAQIGQLATTTWAATALITANNTASTVCMTTASAECSVRITGQIVVSTSGNLTARGLKVTSGTLTYRAACWTCGIPGKADEMRKLSVYDGNGWVCWRCFELPNPQEFVRGIPDRQNVPWTQPIPPPNFIGGAAATQVKGSGDMVGQPMFGQSTLG